MMRTVVHLVGVGCGGSYTGQALAWKGKDFVDELHAWDGDIVEAHNIGPQTYTSEHLGMPKVVALAAQMKSWADIDLVTHNEYVDRSQNLQGIAIVIPDSMESRKRIWETCVKRQSGVALMIEARLEESRALIHVIDPNNDTHVRKWERYWYPDDESTTAGMSCGRATARGPIAPLLGNLVVWQLVRYLDIARGNGDRLDNQIRLEMSPLRIETFQW